MQENNQNIKWWTLIGVGILSFLGCVDFTIVNTALPAIQINLLSTINQLQWVITIFITALSTCMVVAGRIADIYGRRLLLYIGMLSFALSSLGAGSADSMKSLILFRSIQGISCAILYTASGAIISNVFPARERGKAMGILFGINGVGLAVGPVLGGIILNILNWRWIFYINIPFIIISLFVCLKYVKESKNESESQAIDWLGVITLVISLTTLIVSITQMYYFGLIFSLVTFYIFYHIEKKAKSPIIFFPLFLNKTFIASIVATACLAAFYCIAFFLIPLYLQFIHGQSEYKIGLILLSATITITILSPIVGRIVDSIGPKPALVFGFFCFILSAIMQSVFAAHTSISYILTSLIVMGMGWACILGPSTVASLMSVPEKNSAVAIGASWTLHNVGGAIGLTLGTFVFHLISYSTLITDLHGFGFRSHSDSWINEAINHPEFAIQTLQQHIGLNPNEITHLFNNYFLSGYQASMWLMAIISILALIIISLTINSKHKEKS